MICYKDMTFCSSPTCANKECSRHTAQLPKKIPNGLPVSKANLQIGCAYFFEARPDGD